jgi:retron-type reverse transcriptase
MVAEQHTNGQKNTQKISQSRLYLPGTTLPTTDGTPQGGIISATLANMALDGAEKLLKDIYWTNKKGTTTYAGNKHKVLPLTWLGNTSIANRMKRSTEIYKIRIFGMSVRYDVCQS